MKPPRRVVFDVARDGFTGEKQDIDCWACGRPMVSKEYSFSGAKLWTTIHDTDHCRELARQLTNGCAGRMGDAFRHKQKPKSKKAYSQTADP
jgi:hypothetical protein